MGRRIAAIVLARARSSRLKGKMTLPFNGHETVVEAVIERIRQSQLIDDVVLATSNLSDDDVFTIIAERANISLVRGSENDVVARMRMAVGSLDTPPDAIARACADNPLLMPSIVDESLSQLINSGSDVVTPFESNSYPFGFSLVAMTADCLARIDAESTDALYREHVENYCFDNPERFTIGYQEAPPELTYPELCLTLDYVSDYVRLERYANAVRGISIDKQPNAIIDARRQTRLCIVDGSGTRKTFESVAYGFTNQYPAFLENLNNLNEEEYDLIISTYPLDRHPDISAPLGVIWPGPEADSLRPLLCRLDAGEAFVVHEGTMQDGEDDSAFLARELKDALPHFLAGPPRALSERHKSGEKMKRNIGFHQPGMG